MRSGLPTALRRAPARWVAVGAAALVVLSAGLYLALNRDKPAEAAGSGTVSTVRRGTVETTEAAAGTVQPAQTRGLSFGTSGTVTAISVNPGDLVTAGDVLARIDDSDAQEAVSTAESSVAQAEQAVTDAQSSTSTSGTGVCPAAYLLPAGSEAASASPAPTSSPSPSASGRPQVGPTASTGTGSGGGAG